MYGAKYVKTDAASSCSIDKINRKCDNVGHKFTVLLFILPHKAPMTTPSLPPQHLLHTLL